MSVTNFKPALSLVLAHEGGYVNHPKDPGGETNKGITKKVYDDFRRVHGWPVQSVRFITSTEVAEIYKQQYWNLVRGDDLPAGLDYCVFDFAVNSGVSRATRYLQRQLKVDDDSVIGNGTLSAVYSAAKTNEQELILRYCANRLEFLKSLNTFPTFGKGWTRRVIGEFDGVQAKDTGVIDYAIGMAKFDRIYIMPSEAGGAKAYAEPAKIDYYPEADLTKLAAYNDALNIDIVKSLAA